MRTWKAAERLVRQEIAASVSDPATRDHPLVIAVGGRRPKAVMALGPVVGDDAREDLADLAALAAAFGPTRVLVCLAVPDTDRPGDGMAVCCDATAVPDGVVEVTRAWAWRRAGRRTAWLPVELRRWKAVVEWLPVVADVILRRRRPPCPDEVIQQLVEVSVAAGHRVRVARRATLTATAS